MAVLPSAEIATEHPWRAGPTAPLPASLLPCCDQTPPLRVNTHTAPAARLSVCPPTIAVLPSAEIATEMPWRAAPTAPLPTSLPPCCDHAPPLRTNTHAAPAPELSEGAPAIAVSPSAEIATDLPCQATPTAPVPASLPPCCVQAPSPRVNTHAAPALAASAHPPRMAVFPSAEIATEAPCWAAPTAPLPTSLVPCWANCAAAACAMNTTPRIATALRVIVFSRCRMPPNRLTTLYDAHRARQNPGSETAGLLTAGR